MTRVLASDWLRLPALISVHCFPLNDIRLSSSDPVPATIKRYHFGEKYLLRRKILSLLVACCPCCTVGSWPIFVGGQQIDLLRLFSLRQLSKRPVNNLARIWPEPPITPQPAISKSSSLARKSFGVKVFSSRSQQLAIISFDFSVFGQILAKVPQNYSFLSSSVINYFWKVWSMEQAARRWEELGDVIF